MQVVAKSLDDSFRHKGNDSSIWFFCDTDEKIASQTNARYIFREKPKFLYYPRLLWRLFILLCREKPDAVFGHTTNTAVPGLILAALAGIKQRVAVQHNPLNTYGKKARQADRLCANFSIYWRNVVVAETVKKTMTDYSPKALTRVRLIYNGMRMPAAKTTLTIEEDTILRRTLKLPAGLPLLVTIGRLVDQKNQSVLIDALRLLNGVALAIGGDGPLRDTLQTQIETAGLSERVRLLGSVDAAGVRTLLGMADVFVTPSHFEAMPIVVLEAMQEGAVIVASDIDAHRELLADAGLLIAATASDICTAVKSLLDDPLRRQHLSEAAVRRASLFSEEAMAVAYLNLLSENGPK